MNTGIKGLGVVVFFTAGVYLSACSSQSIQNTISLIGIPSGILGQLSSGETVQIVRDIHGVPHIKGETDFGALYGMGYAAAEDRFFQMSYYRVIAQGRAAEFFGRGPDDVFLKSDRLKRLFGYSQYAAEVIELADEETRLLLEAYASGVNHYIQQPNAEFHPLFAQYNVPIESWRAEDVILLWTFMARVFSNDGLEESEKYHKYLDGVDLSDPRVIDNSGEVVHQSDVSSEYLDAVNETAEECGYQAAALLSNGNTGEKVKFSNAYAISGAMSSTGKPMLVGDPRAPVMRPSGYWEAHIEGNTINARGGFIVGTLALMAGSNGFVSWSPTAMGADISDLFYLNEGSCTPGKYLLDSSCVDYQNQSSVEIKILGESSEFHEYKESYFGPVVTAVASDVQEGEVFAVKSTLLNRPEQDGVYGFLAMMRSRSAVEFMEALEKWRQPSSHIVFAAEDGIGYSAVGAIPLRKTNLPFAGKIAQDGSTTESDWCKEIPAHQLPRVLNPAEGFIVSANHLSAGEWYPIPLGVMTGGQGDSHRSRRIRELLQAKSVHTPTDLLGYQNDLVQPSRRDVVRFGKQLHDFDSSLEADAKLSQKAKDALTLHLNGWLNSGAGMTDAHHGVVLAHFINVKFRGSTIGGTEGYYLECTYGGGENGMNFWSKTKLSEMHGTNPELYDLTPPNQCFLDHASNEPSLYRYSTAKYVNRLLEMAFDDAIAEAGSDPGAWLQWYRDNVLTLQLESWTAIREEFPSLMPGDIETVGPMLSTDPDALHAAGEQIFSHFFAVGEPSLTRSKLPLGTSEHIDSPFEKNQKGIYETGAFKASPETLEQAKALGISSEVILELNYSESLHLGGGSPSELSIGFGGIFEFFFY